MWIDIPNHPHVRKAWVSWRPPQQSLHYPQLYAGIYEFLREPPVSGRAGQAREYLGALLQNHRSDSAPAEPLQRDRIAWVCAWLAALPEMQQVG